MKNNNGFTLLETLVAFSIFLVIITSLPQVLKIIHFERKLLHHMETTLFFQQLSMDVQQAFSITVVNNRLHLQHSEHEQVTYDLFQDRIRRQVNNLGQETVLQNVAQINFVKWKNGIDVTILDSYNQTHEQRITHLLPLEQMKNE